MEIRLMIGSLVVGLFKRKRIVFAGNPKPDVTRLTKKTADGHTRLLFFIYRVSAEKSCPATSTS